jgi:TRAP-type C4-dicarboxylate transport system permease large subunit
VEPAPSGPGAARRSRPTSLREKIRRSGNLIPCSALIVFIVWVLIAGWATATECAAYGVLGALALAVVEQVPELGELLGRTDGHDAQQLHDHVHPRRAAFLTKTMAFTGIPARLAEGVNALQLSALSPDLDADADLPGARAPRWTASA